MDFIENPRPRTIGWLIAPFPGRDCPIDLPAKDRPIFLTALRYGATHLLTGDMRHFGPFMNDASEIGGQRPYFRAAVPPLVSHLANSHSYCNVLHLDSKNIPPIFPISEAEHEKCKAHPGGGYGGYPIEGRGGSQGQKNRDVAQKGQESDFDPDHRDSGFDQPGNHFRHFLERSIMLW